MSILPRHGLLRSLAALAALPHASGADDPGPADDRPFVCVFRDSRSQIIVLTVYPGARPEDLDLPEPERARAAPDWTRRACFVITDDLPAGMDAAAVAHLEEIRGRGRRDVRELIARRERGVAARRGWDAPDDDPSAT